MSDKQSAAEPSTAVVRDLKVKVRHVDMRRLANEKPCDDTLGEVTRKVTPRPQAVPSGAAPDPSEILNRR